MKKQESFFTLHPSFFTYQSSFVMNSIDNLITSIQNPKIKKLVSLQQKSAERRKEQLFVVEGQRELSHCIEAGSTPSSIVLPSSAKAPPSKVFFPILPTPVVLKLHHKCMKKLPIEEPRKVLSQK